MDWPAHEIAQAARKLSDLGLSQTDAHPLDKWRFRAEAKELRAKLDAYLGDR